MNNHDDSVKYRQLRRHKAFATGLFAVMVLLYALAIWAGRHYPHVTWPYVAAFAEAAMVGALADWFAVTALFRYPLGLRIPHTNLIEHSKESIGNNLGGFVVDNFLTPATLRPYVARLSVAARAGAWLSTDKAADMLLHELRRIVLGVLNKISDETATNFLAQKGSGLLQELQLHNMLAAGMRYILERGGHQEAITTLAAEIARYINTNNGEVRDRVKKESFFFIPNAINNKLADKITTGLAEYFLGVATDEEHPLRAEITAQLERFAANVDSEPQWQDRIRKAQEEMLSPERLSVHAGTAWLRIRGYIIDEMSNEQGGLIRYLRRSLQDFSAGLQTDVMLQARIDNAVRVAVYRLVLRHRTQAGSLISTTVGKWPGRELSEKLELQVGKDLQYIRINGTIVGGLIGLLIYVITRLLEQ